MGVCVRILSASRLHRRALVLRSALPDALSPQEHRTGAVTLCAVNPGPQRVAYMRRTTWNMDFDRRSAVLFIQTIPLLNSDSQPVTRV